MARADVLRSVYAALERDAALVAYLGHVASATSVQGGARIVGDSIRLDSLPLPLVVLGFEGGDALAAMREEKDWTLSALLYAEDVFQAAELLDLVEDACLDARLEPTDPQPLNQLRPGAHARLEPQNDGARLIAVRLNLTAKWIS